MSNTLTFHLLGGLTVSRGGHPVSGFHSRKEQALLCYLAVTGKPHLRHFLAGLFWGDWPERRAHGNLRRALTHLRAAAGEHLLVTRQTVAFRRESDYWLDVEVFEGMVDRWGGAQGGAGVQSIVGLREAVKLYRGDFLAGFSLKGCPAFEEWVFGEQERLRGLALKALRILIDMQRARGEYPAAIASARQLLTLAPWLEEAHRELMQLLALTGQRSAALAQYEKCRRLLADELGLEPLEETRVLYERLVSWEVGTSRDRKTAEAGNWAAGPPTFRPVNLPFTGREEEHATLVSWWGAARRGKGRLSLVEGEAGIGKTRLVEEATRYAETQGAIALRGRCREFGNTLPYHPIAEALRPALALPSLAPNLAPVWLAELSLLLPDLRQQYPDLPQPLKTAGEAARQRLFEAVARFLSPNPARPILLFLDDLHWADQSTLDMLHYLTHRLHSRPVWIVGTYRPGEMSLTHPLMQLRFSLGGDHLVNLLTLKPLPAEAVSKIARSLVRADGDALGAFLYRESEGNPFVLSETIETLREKEVLREEAGGRWDFESLRLRKMDGALPDSVRDMVLQRVARLDASARNLLQLAAVIGRHFDPAILQAAARTDADAVRDGLHVWLERHLVRSVPQPMFATDAPRRQTFEFSHHKIHAAICQTIPRMQKPALHRRVGEAFESLPAAAEIPPAVLAHHWEQAGEMEKATLYLLQAGDYARLVYAHQEAADYYRRALAYLKSAGRRDEAARTLMKLGLSRHNALDFSQAHEAYDEGFALWQQAGAARSSAAASPPALRTLRVRWLEPLTLDPAATPDSHTTGLMAHLFSGLVELNAALYITPDVAATWQVSDDGRRFIFRLRDDVRWSDDRPVTACDFEYAWKRVLNPRFNFPAAPLFFDIRGAKAYHQGTGGLRSVGVHAPDPLTLVVELERPAGYFLQLLTHTSFFPVPRHVVEAHEANWADAEHIVTNGAFRPAAWHPGHSLTIVRNPAYHGQFKGNIRQVVLHSIADWETRLQMYRQDELDVLGITYFPPEERDALRQQYAGEYIVKPRLETHYIVFDDSPPFDDARVRQAFAMAVDKERLANVVMGGHTAPATGGLVPPGMPGYNPDIGLPCNPQQARRLLAEAGYRQGRGFPVVTGLAFQAVADRCAFLADQWRANLGVTVVWQIETWAAYLNRLEKEPRAALVALNWLADYPDPDNFLRVSRARSWQHWQNPVYDGLIAQAGQATDHESRMKLYRQAETILMREAAVLPVCYERNHLLIKPWVRRYPMSAIRPTFWQDAFLS